MTKLSWDDTGERIYETGTSKGVLFPKKNDGTYAKGVAWNGLTAVSESPSGAEETALYADDVKYLSLRSAEEFGATVEAYTYPDEWAECDGSASLADGIYIGQQTRRGFGLSYRTVLGNDAMGNDFGYKLHIIYNAMASPSEKSYATINDSPEAITFSWEMTTTPVKFRDDLKPSATLTIDSTKIDAAVLKEIEDKLYGTENSDPELPTPEWIINKVASSEEQPTPTPATPDRYEFTSYDDEQKTTEWGTGVVEVVSVDNGYTTVKVIENSSDQSFVNQQFKVHGTTYHQGDMYELLDLSDNAVGIWVEIGAKVTA